MEGLVFWSPHTSVSKAESGPVPAELTFAWRRHTHTKCCRKQGPCGSILQGRTGPRWDARTAVSNRMVSTGPTEKGEKEVREFVER